MPIIWRLRISYGVMLFIPLVLIVFSWWVIIQFTGYSNSNILFHEINPTEQILNRTHKILGEVNRVLIEDQDKFLDREFTRQFSQQLNVDNVELIIRRNESFIYAPESARQMVKSRKLWEFKEFDSDSSYISDPKHEFIVIRLFDFYFSDKSEGTIFLWYDTIQLNRRISLFQGGFLLLTIIMLLISNVIFTLVVYKSMVAPLKQLQSAAEAIKKGDLDKPIEYYSRDEFRDVFKSFEELRQKLKKSIVMHQQYEENRKLLISSISHDLKTPITTIRGYVEGIRDKVADTPEKMDRYIDTISKKALEMDELIDDLFLFSKLDVQKHSFDFTVINIIMYIKDMVEELRFYYEEKGITIRTHFTEEKVNVSADVNNLRRVFENIFTNCIKYSGTKPLTIDIYLENGDDFVQIEIKDNGKGISEESMEFVFDSFYRADLSRNNSLRGSGLGLAIVKKIILEHHGSVWAKSEINEGTSIFFTLKKNK